MADVTKCDGDNCPFKERCHRFTVPANPNWQSFFSETPINISKEPDLCEMFWDNGEENETDDSD